LLDSLLQEKLVLEFLKSQDVFRIIVRIWL